MPQYSTVYFGIPSLSTPPPPPPPFPVEDEADKDEADKDVDLGSSHKSNNLTLRGKCRYSMLIWLCSLLYRQKSMKLCTCKYFRLGLRYQRHLPSHRKVMEQTSFVFFNVSQSDVFIQFFFSTLVQALRFCTGRTAHRASRGIALLFHDHGTRRG